MLTLSFSSSWYLSWVHLRVRTNVCHGNCLHLREKTGFSVRSSSSLSWTSSPAASPVMDGAASSKAVIHVSPQWSMPLMLRIYRCSGDSLVALQRSQNHPCAPGSSDRVTFLLQGLPLYSSLHAGYEKRSGVTYDTFTSAWTQAGSAMPMPSARI